MQVSNDLHTLSHKIAETTKISPERVGCQKQTVPSVANNPIRWAPTLQALTRWRHQSEVEHTRNPSNSIMWYRGVTRKKADRPGDTLRGGGDTRPKIYFFCGWILKEQWINAWRWEWWGDDSWKRSSHTYSSLFIVTVTRKHNNSTEK